jgi:hypothetical protein
MKEAQSKVMAQAIAPATEQAYCNVQRTPEGGLLTFNLAGLQEMIRQEIRNALHDYAPKEAPAPEEPRYYTRDEVATMLHVSLTTLTKWRQAGTLTPVKIGGRTLYPSESVKKALHTMRGRR